MGSSEFPRKPLKVLVGNLAVDDHPIHEGVVILLATYVLHGNWDKLWLGGSIGSSTGFTF